MNPSIIYSHFTDKKTTAQKIKLSKIALTPKETNVDSQKGHQFKIGFNGTGREKMFKHE